MFVVVNEYQNIRVTKKLAARLRDFGKKGETYEDVLWRLVKLAEQENREAGDEWGDAMKDAFEEAEEKEVE